MNGDEQTPLTDYRLAAAATLLGGRLLRVVPDPNSGRLTFVFKDLPADFTEAVFNGSLTVNLRDYIAALESVQTLIAQHKLRRGR